MNGHQQQQQQQQQQNNAIHDRWCPSIDSYVISILPTFWGGLQKLQMSSLLTTELDSGELYGRFTVLWPRVCSLPVWQISSARNSALVGESCRSGQRCNVWSLFDLFLRERWQMVFRYLSFRCIDGQWISHDNHKFKNILYSPNITEHAVLSFTLCHMFFVSRQCFYVSEFLCAKVAICNIDMDFKEFWSIWNPWGSFSC